MPVKKRAFFTGACVSSVIDVMTLAVTIPLPTVTQQQLISIFSLEQLSHFIRIFYYNAFMQNFLPSNAKLLKIIWLPIRKRLAMPTSFFVQTLHHTVGSKDLWASSYEVGIWKPLKANPA